jgi:hypothetical protein
MILSQGCIQQYDGSCKVLRFLDKDGLLRTLGLFDDDRVGEELDNYPTFLLRSAKHYSRMEEDPVRHDCYENDIVVKNDDGAPLSYANLNCMLLSCWSLYQGKDLGSPVPWSAFPDSIAVIESTINDITNIVTVENIQNNFNEEFSILGGHCPAHGRIVYYQEHDRPHHALGPSTIFFKRRSGPVKCFEEEKEYRFLIESVCINLDKRQPDYIGKIYLKKSARIRENIMRKMRSFYSDILEII